MFENKKMNVKLTVSIPTFNRAVFLKECLENLVPQLAGRNDVEVNVIDNCSTDNTESVVKKFINSPSNIKYFKNASNLGYTGNQIKCFKYASGEYVSLLSDDDVYLDGEVDEILKVINKGKFAFIALNYYSFFKDVRRPYKHFAPEKDINFVKASDILNYPSVGHYSAVILNTVQARKNLQDLIAQGKHLTAEKSRGILTEVYIRVLAKTDLPSYFIGKKKLAARMPEQLDYDLLKHLCVDHYDLYYGFYRDGFITADDFNFRIGLILDMLPKAIIKDLHKYEDKEVRIMAEKLTADLKEYRKFRLISLPLLYLGKFKIVRYLYRFLSGLVDFKRIIIRKIKQ